MNRAGSVAVFLMLVLAACTGNSGNSPNATPDTGEAPKVAGDDTATTTEPCSPSVTPIELTTVPGVTSGDLIELSSQVYSCMTEAVVVGGSNVTLIGEGSRLAASNRVPLLRSDTVTEAAAVASELERLEVTGIATFGLSEDVRLALTAATNADIAAQTIPTTAPTTTTSAPATTAPPSSETGTDEAPAETTVTETTLAETTVVSVETDDAVVTTTALPATTTIPVPVFRAASGLQPADPGGPVVLIAPADTLAAYLLHPAISAGGGEVVVVDTTDTDAMRAAAAGRTNVLLNNATTPTDQWRAALAASENELFGGGTRMFPDRRIIAYYGNPLTFRLGLLGETDPDRAVERVSERAELYNAEGLPPALPGFEIIVTVAATQAGDDNDYSNEMDIEVVRPWIDAAMANDVSVILDLQPGRTSFLTQAKLYEEFLRLPNVGLALDPEWRLKPDQRHLRQIGSVGADEINSVVDYLTDLVHEETLPQKVLILHQFNTRMLPERELVRTPPEVAVVIHVDGQGSLGAKYGTWGAMLDAPTSPEQNLSWAWKNFIDEDFPTATPGQVNRVEPLPVIVTYQ